VNYFSISRSERNDFFYATSSKNFLFHAAGAAIIRNGRSVGNFYFPLRSLRFILCVRREKLRCVRCVKPFPA
jgi:hypothetical protein